MRALRALDRREIGDRTARGLHRERRGGGQGRHQLRQRLDAVARKQPARARLADE